MDRCTKAEEVIALAASVALSAVFVYAGAIKVLDLASFALAIDNYRLLPYPAAAALAMYLPWLELICGGAVLWPRIRLGAVAVLLGLCLVFGGAIASAWIRGLDISCGCFGGDGGGRTSLVISFIRSVALLLLCAWLLWRERQQRSPNDRLRTSGSALPPP